MPQLVVYKYSEKEFNSKGVFFILYFPFNLFEKKKKKIEREDVTSRKPLNDDVSDGSIS